MSAATLSKKLQLWFQTTSANPPAAFNPAYRACAAPRRDAAVQQMELEGFYETHTRTECAAELARRIAN
jgi:hypothetical protein